MKHNDIKRDPQLSELLKGSLPPRTPDDAEHFTRRVMRRLPQRRRNPILTLLLAYIQSPLWLVTAVILCVLLFGLRIDFFIEHIDSLPKLCMLMASVVIGATVFAYDILHDTDRVKATIYEN